MAQNQFPFFIKIKGIDEVSGMLTKVQRQVRTIGKSFQKLGQDLTLQVSAPIAALGAFAVKNYLAQEDAITQVRTRLKEVGDQVGITEKQFADVATNLQFKTLFGDEQILRDVTTQFLTFGNITGENFLKAQEAVLDLSTVLKTDLKAQAIQLAKALDNPVKGLTALRKSGIQFSASEEKLIKSMAETGRIAEAQTLILQALDHYYGGAAEAAAEVNPYLKLQNAFGDLLEPFGQIINEMLKPFLGLLKQSIEFVNGLSDSVKTKIVVFAGLIAVLGPILYLIGTLMTTFASLNPYVLAFAAGAALIVTYWEPIEAFFSGVFEGIKEGLRGTSFEFSSLAKFFNIIGDISKKVFTAMGLDIADTITFANALGKTIGFIIGLVVKLAGLLTGVLAFIPKLQTIQSGETSLNRSRAAVPIGLGDMSFSNISTKSIPGQVEVTFSNLPAGATVQKNNSGALKAVNVGYALPGV
ncbi:MAG: phage tail length tape measure family protein [Candidatus Nanopelagicaceae bacterium]